MGRGKHVTKKKHVISWNVKLAKKLFSTLKSNGPQSSQLLYHGVMELSYLPGTANDELRTQGSIHLQPMVLQGIGMCLRLETFGS